MNAKTIRALALTTLLTTTTQLGCGYILYPERRGNRGGNVDAGTMVMDLLWLLAGIVPGVVALIVDFSSGAIYVGGGRALLLAPNGHVAVRLPRASTPTRLEFRLVTASHRVLARKTASVGPSTPEGQSLDLELGDAARALSSQGGKGTSEEIFLEVQNERGASARFPTSMQVALGTTG